MAEIGTYNAYSNSNVLRTNLNSGFKSNNTNNAIYAEKGEPIYQKEMDLDEDGIITLEEFRDYCQENNISVAKQREMLQNRLTFQLHRDRTKSSAEIREIKPETDKIYAKEHDANYDEEIDADNDGKITYDEYLKYCKENEEKVGDEKPASKIEIKKENDNSEDGDEKIVIQNVSKALNKYSNIQNKVKEGKVEDEV